MTDLRSIVSRIERIREEKKALTADERDIFTEAKSSGLDGKALRKVLQRRAMGDAAVAELDAIVDAYEAALGGKLVAAEALKAGASVRQAAKAAGVSVSTAQRTKNQVSEPDRAATSSAPAGGGGKGVAQAMPPRPEPIPQSEFASLGATGASRDNAAMVAVYASDTASPAGAQLPPTRAADCDPAPDAASPRSGPAGETKGGPDTASLAFTSAAARREGQDSAGTDDLTIPPHLRRGTAANARARGL